MAGRRLIYAALLLAAAACFIFFDARVGLAGLLACLLLPLVSLCLFLASARGLSLEMLLPATLREDAEAELRLRCRKNNRLQLARLYAGLEIRNSLSESVTQKQLYVRRLRGPQDEVSFRLRPDAPGRLVVSMSEAYAADALGLFRRRLALPEKRKLPVLPQLYDVDIAEMPQVENSDEGQVYSQHKPGRDNTEIFAMHQYVPGDDIRRIHWKLSSKTEELMVRDFSLPLNYSLFLLLELPKGEAEPSAFPAAVKLLLSLSYALYERQTGHSVGWFDAESNTLLTREIISEEDVAQAAAALVCAEGTPGALALNNVVEGRLLPDNAFIYYVNPAPDEEKLALLRARYNVRLLIPPQDKQIKSYAV